MSVSLPDVSRDVVYISALGASTPVGRDAWSSAAAVRAGMSGFAEHPYMIDAAGEPMRVAMAPWLDVGCSGVDRFEELLRPAVTQALAPFASERAEGLAVALVLALPAPRPGLAADLEQELRARIVRTFPRRFTAVATFQVGHAGGFVGMHAALKKFRDGAFDACVIAGAESYLTPPTLEWLEENEQLHGAGPLNNAWGFIPGEAAGAVLLASGNASERLELEPLGQVLSVGRGFEQNRIKTETVCIGEGLTAAFREALEGLPSGALVTDVFCDLNGEPYRADEFGFSCVRTKEAFVSASDFIAPAEYWGDVSAASMPLHVILSAIAGYKGYANGSFPFLWASSETGERGASLLHVPLRERE